MLKKTPHLICHLPMVPWPDNVPAWEVRACATQIRAFTNKDGSLIVCEVHTIYTIYIHISLTAKCRDMSWPCLWTCLLNWPSEDRPVGESFAKLDTEVRGSPSCPSLQSLGLTSICQVQVEPKYTRAIQSLVVSNTVNKYINKYGDFLTIHSFWGTPFFWKPPYKQIN